MERNKYNGFKYSNSQERIKSPAITISADSKVIPCAGSRETMPVTLAPFKDHGRPAFIASTIKSRNIIQEAASGLTDDESQRLNGLLTRTMENLLDEGIIRSSAVLRSDMPGKPDVHILTSGDPFKHNSLRLYCHVAEHNGARVLMQDARCTKKDADKIEKTFKREGGYHVPQGWENKSN